jgi:cyanophycinase
MTRKLFFLVVILSFTLPLYAGKGNLYIIGGGERPSYMVKKIIELAGGPEKAKIVVIPNASSVPLESALWQRYDFEKGGARNVHFLLFDRSTADTDSNLAILDGATGIYFSGGDQAFLTRDLLGTKLMEKIRTVYANGGVIAGTSAGAAVMSKIMITGNELINKDSTRAFIDIMKGNIENVEGFGFITKAIIDQHFIKRRREHRLFTVVMENPQLLGIGIDESTAIWVKPDDTFEVTGENTILILDASNSRDISTDARGNLSGSGMKMHILKAGQKFDMNKKSLMR